MLRKNFPGRNNLRRQEAIERFENIKNPKDCIAKIIENTKENILKEK